MTTPRSDVGWAVIVGRHRRSIAMRTDYRPDYTVRRAPGPERWEPATGVWVALSFVLGMVAGFALAAGWLP